MMISFVTYHSTIISSSVELYTLLAPRGCGPYPMKKQLLKGGRSYIRHWMVGKIDNDRTFLRDLHRYGTD